MDSTEDKERRKSLKMIINSVGEIQDRVERKLRGVDIREELWKHIQRIENGLPRVTLELSNSLREYRCAEAVIKSAKEELREMG